MGRGEGSIPLPFSSGGMIWLLCRGYDYCKGVGGGERGWFVAGLGWGWGWEGEGVGGVGWGVGVVEYFNFLDG